MRTIFFLLLVESVFCSHAQQSCFLQLGDSVITLESENSTARNGILFINVHENEATSVSALRLFDLNRNYPFVWLKHNGTRRIFFNHHDQVFSVDPNRIFSHEGIVATLAIDSVSNRKAEKMAGKLAHKILRYLRHADWIISLHNNTPDNYSILSYLPGQPEAANTKHVFVSDTMDPDDFIYTTDVDLFNELKMQHINVILQDNENCVNDGSLSVYCGMKGIPYVNVEAEDGHLEQQTGLIRAVIAVIEQN